MRTMRAGVRDKSRRHRHHEQNRRTGVKQHGVAESRPILRGGESGEHREHGGTQSGGDDRKENRSEFVAVRERGNLPGAEASGDGLVHDDSRGGDDDAGGEREVLVAESFELRRFPRARASARWDSPACGRPARAAGIRLRRLLRCLRRGSRRPSARRRRTAARSRLRGSPRARSRRARNAGSRSRTARHVAMQALIGSHTIRPRKSR